MQAIETALKKNIPVLGICLGAQLIASGAMSEAELGALEKAISVEMDASLDFAQASSEPPLASMFRDVYAPGEPEPEPLATRLDRVFARL